jgi:hypothetical protein
LCKRRGVPSRVLREEVTALKRLDIPYFRRRVVKRPVFDRRTALSELIAALAQTIHS